MSDIDDDVRLMLREEYDARQAEYDAQAEREREEAYKAVSKAIATYRWWGFTALKHAFLLWIQSIRYRIQLRLSK